MTKYICHERKGWAEVLTETEHFWVVRWDAESNTLEQVSKDDPKIVGWDDGEEVEDEAFWDEEPNWDLDMGFDPYEGLYTDDC